MNIETLHKLIVALIHREDRDLTIRQLGILLIVYLQDGPHTTGALASTLKIPKPAISRALYRLRNIGLIDQKRCDYDLRVLNGQRTAAGHAFLQDIRDIVEDAPT